MGKLIHPQTMDQNRTRPASVAQVDYLARLLDRSGTMWLWVRQARPSMMLPSSPYDCTSAEIGSLIGMAEKHGRILKEE